MHERKSVEKRECVRVSEYNAIFLCFVLYDDYEWMWRNKCLFLLLFFLFPSSQHKHSSFLVLLWKEQKKKQIIQTFDIFAIVVVVSLMSAYCDASMFLCWFSFLWFAHFLSLFLDLYAPWTTHPSVHVCLAVLLWGEFCCWVWSNQRENKQAVSVLSCINSCVWYDSKIIDMCDMHQKSKFFITSPFREEWPNCTLLRVQTKRPLYAICYSN